MYVCVCIFSHLEPYARSILNICKFVIMRNFLNLYSLKYSANHDSDFLCFFFCLQVRESIHLRHFIRYPEFILLLKARRP